MQLFKRYVIPALIAAVVLPCAILFFASAAPNVTLDPALTAIAGATPVKLRVEDPHSIRRLRVFVEQNGQRYPVNDQAFPSHRLLFFVDDPVRDFTIAAGIKSTPALKEGSATLIVEAESNDFRGSTASIRREITVDTRPPRITTDEVQHYINQGGSELVTYTIGGHAADSGVKVGNYRFRGFALAGSPRKLGFFAYPWDLAEGTEPLVFAANAGEEVTSGFSTKLFPKKFRKRDLAIDDGFLLRVVPAIDGGGSGDLLARFLKINGEMRRQNNRTLAALRFKTEERFLWTGPFLQLNNSKVEALFADVRSYIYKGRKVDEQVHLGFDLAKVRNTPIGASNDGKVALAEKLGIYGNCVVIDHGYALQSIYGHLSSIQVKPGDIVKKGQIIGLSGSTGLAGGDHLHFGMQLEGMQVNPVEWWDAHWIHDHVLSRVKEGK